MERDVITAVSANANGNFNSHAHVERDQFIFNGSPCFFISTHTLTWSVTLSLSPFNTYKVISTHTLTWSVTPYALGTGTLRSNFNSHAHVERD